MELPPQVRPACSFDNPHLPRRVRLVELLEPGIGVGLKNAVEVLQMLLRPDTLAIRREVIGDRRRRWPRPRPVIAHIRPDPTLFDALAKAFDAAVAIKNPDMRVITMDTLTRHHALTDPLNQRGQNPDAAPTPVGQRRIRDIRPHPLEDLIEAIERKVVVVFGDQDERQQARARHAARYRAARRRRLHDRLAAAAGFSRTDDLCDRQPGGDHVEHLAHVFAYRPQRPSARRAVLARVEQNPLARRCL